MKNIQDSFTDFPLRKNKKNIKIGVIAGGISPEREVSLSTGKGIYKALLKCGYRAEFIDFNGNVEQLLKKIEAAFLALHGKYGEDGTVQGLFELIKIPYTGSGVLASAAAMDKIFTKKVFQFEKILTPCFLALNKFIKYDIEDMKASVKENIGYPLIVKPNRGGSSIGVTIVNSAKGLKAAIDTAYTQDSEILIEKYIPGRLLTVAIVGKIPVALPVVEIKPLSGFYDYASKYTAGLTEYIVPAELDKKTSGNITKTALKCHGVLGCDGVSRVDLILDRENNAYIIEVNTIPGMTSTSLVPKAAAACGINFESLVEIILNCASLKL